MEAGLSQLLIGRNYASCGLYVITINDRLPTIQLPPQILAAILAAILAQPSTNGPGYEPGISIYP